MTDRERALGVRGSGDRRRNREFDRQFCNVRGRREIRMSPPAIGQDDWTVLCHAYGEVLAELLVYRRCLAERDAEIEALRQQLTACADALHTPPEPDGGVGHAS